MTVCTGTETINAVLMFQQLERIGNLPGKVNLGDLAITLHSVKCLYISVELT